MTESLHAAALHCRLCKEGVLEGIFDLGDQPPANALRRPDQAPPPGIPLALSRCPQCGTVQLSHTVDPEYLFRDYVWVTGTSRTAREYSETFRGRVEARIASRSPLSVLEVASNDGTFLSSFAARGHRVLGVDPARNLARLAVEAGIPTLAEFFGLDTARRVTAEHGTFDVVIARNVLPHVPDPADIIAGMAQCLSPDGVGAIEFHRADIIIDEFHYDSIYHEHVFYHSLHTLEPLLRKHGLPAFDVDESPISGGSFVLYVSRDTRATTAALDRARERERVLGVGTKSAWVAFADRCRRHATAFKALVEAAGRRGRVVGYGASARSSTLLNYCAIGRDHLDCVADASSLKHGLLTPGSDLPIRSPEEAFAEPPAAVVLLAWNFEAEILAHLRGTLGYRGEVIVPLPRDPRVIGA